MAVAMLHRNTQPNFVVKEGSVTVIGKAITARDYASKKDRAIAAYQQKDSLYKNTNYATTECNTTNTQEIIVTNCGVFNATGDPIQFIIAKEWNGQVRSSYPKEIGNGQWGLFVHTKRAMVPEGSKAAVVYRIKNAKEQQFDWMCAWDNPRRTQSATTHILTEIGEINHFDNKVWPKICEDLKTARREGEAKQNGLVAEVNITEDPNACLAAVITLEN